MLNLDEVVTFQAVASIGNFTIVAEQLHVTQSTISHQIKRLEEQVGQKLFVRTTRSVKLTLAGERFLPHAEKLIAVSNAAELSVSVENITGEVRIGVPEEFACSKLPELLTRFRLHYQKVALAIEVGVGSALTDKIESGGLDIAIVKEVPASADCIRREQLVWVGRKEVLEINPMPFAFFPSPCSFRTVAIAAMESRSIVYSVVLTSASLEVLRIAAEAGTVVTVTAHSQCPPSLLLQSCGDGLPELPEMGYRIKWNQKSAQPVKIAADIIHELLVR
ncbi:MAG: LysR family transcriptional regulator [Sedimenticola sp.]